ncbi:DDE-type integrase/transposase/recombinase [Streptomyces sp. NBC_01255]|uniref:DDE-type integrase/transposase/recombinase n=1 Tax=Streptomyces sp. NBC_01255 TaxID=2903798 RepID=UPI003FCEAA7E
MQTPRALPFCRKQRIEGGCDPKSIWWAKRRSSPRAPPSPDLILRDFTAPLPGLKFVGDITCLPTAEGRLYPATVIDLCTREVVGWSMADHLRTELVADAIRMAHLRVGMRVGTRQETRSFTPIAGRNTRPVNSVTCWASRASGRAPDAPVRASTTLPRRASSPS